MKQNETSGQTIERLAKRVEFLENGINNLMMFCFDENHKVRETNDDHLFNLWSCIDGLHGRIMNLTKKVSDLEDKRGMAGNDRS